MVEDAKLCEMKEQNATWKQIMQTIDNKTKSQLQERYKHLMKCTPKSEEARKEEEKKKAIAEKKKAENLAKAGKKDKVKGKADEKVCASIQFWCFVLQQLVSHPRTTRRPKTTSTLSPTVSKRRNGLLWHQDITTRQEFVSLQRRPKRWLLKINRRLLKY